MKHEIYLSEKHSKSNVVFEFHEWRSRQSRQACKRCQSMMLPIFATDIQLARTDPNLKRLVTVRRIHIRKRYGTPYVVASRVWVSPRTSFTSFHIYRGVGSYGKHLLYPAKYIRSAFPTADTTPTVIVVANLPLLILV